MCACALLLKHSLINEKRQSGPRSCISVITLGNAPCIYMLYTDDFIETT